MKKTMALVLVILMLPICFCSAAGSSYVVLTGDGLQVLAGDNIHTPLPMASTTKIMTAVVALENASLSETVKVTAESAGVEGSSMYLKTDQIITVEELLYGLLLVSGNDAANALALHIAGSVEGFAELMNQKAAELELEHTHFVNPSGLHDKSHYTSAYDLAKLTAYALQNETFAAIVSTKTHKYDGATLVNHNRLLRELDGCIGVKTGYTKDSGRCLVSAVKRDGVTVICVSLRCSDDWNRHKALYAEHLDRCVSQEVISEKQVYLALRVAGGRSVGCYSLPASGTIVDDVKELRYSIQLPRFIYSGAKQGQAVGKVVIYNRDTKLAQSDLILDRDAAAMPIKKSKFMKLLEFILHKLGF